jgi:hypothetical protein
MKMKNAVCLVLIFLVFLFASATLGYAIDGRASRGGIGLHGGGEYYGGVKYHGGGDWHGDIWIGPGWGGWGPWWWGPSFYPYYYPYYPETPAVIQQQPSLYVQPEEQYWYFCRNPEGYYPYIKKCPGGWLKVIPPALPDEEE